MTQSIFISATDTGIGKTYYSVKILKDLLANKYNISDLAYYKPIQCGADKDYEVIEKSIKGIKTYCTYDLAHPASPHFAAERESVEISLEKIRKHYEEIQSKHQVIIVEGAGGLAVPITNNGQLVSDIAKMLNLPLVLVVRAGLGTINHSLLSLEHAKAKGLEVLGIIVSEHNPDSNLNRTKNAIDTIIKIGNTKIFNIKQIADARNLQVN